MSNQEVWLLKRYKGASGVLGSQLVVAGCRLLIFSNVFQQNDDW